MLYFFFMFFFFYNALTQTTLIPSIETSASNRITTTTSAAENFFTTTTMDDTSCNLNDCDSPNICCDKVCCSNYMSCCNGGCYVFDMTPTTWDNADCTGNYRGALVSMANSSENMAITNCGFKTSSAITYWWIGYYEYEKGKWTTSDGSQVTLLNFAPGQETKYENGRAAINSPTGSWYSFNTTVSFPYICKIRDPKMMTSTLSSSSTSLTTPNSRVSSSTESRNISSSKWWLWLIVGGILLFIIGIIIIIYFIRKQFHGKKSNKFLQSMQAKIGMSLFVTQIGKDERITRYLEPKNVLIYYKDVLGKGASATIYKVFIKLDFKKNVKTTSFKNCYAAIKIPNKYEEDDVEQFDRELDALIRVGGHANVINFIGWTLYHKMPSLITELASGGNLLQYVTSFRNEVIPINTGISILWQISQALEYVASLKLVHRDVACRNILLTEKNVAKLSDFGLCCHCDDETLIYQGSLHKRMPIKWLSIEALVDRKFSEKSDVWSFGILCYEIFSYGAVPYPAMTNMEMLEFLQAGNRLQKPLIAPEEIYAMMLDCWKDAVEDRPAFNQIRNYLTQILEKNNENYGYVSLVTHVD